MKVLIVVSAFLAVASAGYLSPVAYHSGLHVPVLDHNGYQLDTPEVAHAKAAHFAAHAEANSRIAHGAVGALAVAAPLAYAGHYGGHYAGPQHIPVIGANGVPLDTPEVAHARAAHAAAVAEAQARNGDHYGYGHSLGHYRRRRGIYGAAYAAPVPLAHAYAGPQHIPVIGPNGVPLDTPEVAAGKVANAVAHAEAHARNGAYAVGGHGIVAPVAAAHGVVAPVAALPYAGHYAQAPYAGPQHIPVIGPNGVPLDTPEVAHARAAHYAAFAETAARDAHYGHHY